MPGSLDTTVRRWKASSGEAVGEPLRGHNNTIKSFAIREDGNVLFHVQPNVNFSLGRSTVVTFIISRWARIPQVFMVFLISTKLFPYLYLMCLTTCQKHVVENIINVLYLDNCPLLP